MFRHQRVQQFRFARLVEIGPGGHRGGLRRAKFYGRIDRKELLDNHPLLNGRLELVIHHIELVEGALDKVVGQIPTDVDGMLKT